MAYSEIAMVREIVDDLTAELEPTDDQFSAVLLESKVIGAYRDVRRVRKYPSYYTDEMIENDMESYYPVVKEIALYDYDKIGFEGQTRNSENEVSRSFVSRSSLFNGVLTLSPI